jgi:hypothetical protein
MRRVILSFIGGATLLLVLLTAAATQAQAQTPVTCTQYAQQDPAFRILNLKVSGSVAVSWTPKRLAHGLPSEATTDIACNVAAELADNASLLWGEQGANVPANDITSGVGPTGHQNVSWTSAGWTHHTGGSVKQKKVLWTFHQKGMSGKVTFEMDCAYKLCKAV